jgi:site-specific DNA recombinase
MSKRAVIYARVSTDEQAEKSSLISQAEECRRYAAQQGLTVVKEISDDISGSLPVFDRPGGKILQSMIDTQAIDAIIVYRVDRLSRRLGDLITTVESWLESGVVVHILDIGLVKSANDITLVIKGWQGGDEWMKIAERTTGGRNDKATKEKKIVMSGHPPYGYRREGRKEDARLFVNEAERPIVRAIFEWYVIGDGSNGPLSLRAIAAKLEDMQIPTPHYRSNASERWIPATVRGILVNEIYAGRTYYGKTRMIKKSEFQRHGKRTKMDYKDWIPIDAPELAIVERDIFEAVQDRARRNQERAKRNQKREYLMTGHFRCGACNSAMAGSASRPNGYLTVYYRCGNHWRSIKNEACPNMNKTVIRDKVDSAVWNWLADLLKDDQAIIDGIRDMRERSEAETGPKQRRLEQIDGLIENRRRSIDRLISELGDEENEVIKDALKTRVKFLGKEIESLTGERDSLFAELSHRSISPELEAEVLRIAAEIRVELDAPDFETRRYLLDKLNVQAVFQADDTGRWLDVKCGIIPDWESIMLRPSLAFFQR